MLVPRETFRNYNLHTSQSHFLHQIIISLVIPYKTEGTSTTWVSLAVVLRTRIRDILGSNILRTPPVLTGISWISWSLQANTREYLDYIKAISFNILS
jgi:hypothetical protein